jgi:hypothetical protein
MSSAAATKNLGARGRARMRELAEQAAIEAKVELDKLVADLGGNPSASQLALAEQAAALIVRCRRLRRNGRAGDADACTMLLTRVMGRLGVREGSAKPIDPLAAIKAKYATAPALSGEAST